MLLVRYKRWGTWGSSYFPLQFAGKCTLRCGLVLDAGCSLWNSKRTETRDETLVASSSYPEIHKPKFKWYQKWQMGQITIFQAGMNLCVPRDFSEEKKKSPTQLKSTQGRHLQTFCNLFSGKDHGNNSGSQINLNKLSLHFKKIHGRVKVKLQMPWLKMSKQDLRVLRWLNCKKY